MKNNIINSKYDHILSEVESSKEMFDLQSSFNKEALLKSNIFSILLPPPNVTGKLHIGHAWNVTIQDCLIRFNLLNDKSVYWICGMDHAGIATQTKYESTLKNKTVLNNLSRKEKINNVYNWAQENANSIREQWKKLGLFLDYENEWFTLQEKSNEIVNNVFVKLYNDKLIYKAKTLVNWDTKLQTAISNIEVIKKDTETSLYNIKYFIENEDNEFLVVATTRPETIFVDECLIVNPDDKRYQKYLNKNAINPLTGNLIKIIADSYVDKDFGTGVMKCTPAHDFNDYELGKKYNLKTISCFNHDGKTNAYAKGFENLKINDCREKVIKYFKDNNLLYSEEKTISNIGYSERTGVVVEPMLSDQWFISMEKYSKKIIDYQKTENKVLFYPAKFEKMLINWLLNINDWCISRQLWWGHQIPAWYKNDTKEIYVSSTPPKDIENYTRDNDVLDTWFSSGLWPIITSDCLSKKTNLFPTDVLVTGFDIIFFWVSRMMFFSLYLTEKMPFKNVYITGLIRDSLNRKMSKSLGNGIDPNDVVEKYGADALRLFLLSSSSPGEDLCYSEQKLKSCWGYINKIWNSFRYIQINSEGFIYNENSKPNNFNSFDKWILNEFHNMVSDYKKQFNKFNFLVGIKKLMDFSWDIFCNSYIELNKHRAIEKDESHLWVLNYLIKKILILLHPICPFVTNKLYDSFSEENKKESILFEKITEDEWKFETSDEISIIIKIINRIRNFLLENKLDKKERIFINVKRNDKNIIFSEELKNILDRANIEIDVEYCSENPDIVDQDFIIYVKNKKNDTDSEIDKEKIEKEIEKMNFEINRCESMLNNQNFINKAPKKKIDEEKAKKEKYESQLKTLLQLLNK